MSSDNCSLDHYAQVSWPLARKLENMFWRQLWQQEAQKLRWLTYDSKGHQKLSIIHDNQPLWLAWPRVIFICNHSLGVGCRMTHKIIQIICNLLLLFMWKNHSFCHIWGQFVHSYIITCLRSGLLGQRNPSCKDVSSNHRNFNFKWGIHKNSWIIWTFLTD